MAPSGRTTLRRVCKASSRPILPRNARFFHQSPASSVLSPLFALQALSNSRETQHFNKASGLSRVEHSPNLELLRASEVDPFKRKAVPPAVPNRPVSVEQQVKATTSPLPKATTNIFTSNIPSTSANAIRDASNFRGVPREVPKPPEASTVTEPQADPLRDTLVRMVSKHEQIQKSWKTERAALVHERDRFRRYTLLVTFFGGVVLALSTGLLLTERGPLGAPGIRRDMKTAVVQTVPDEATRWSTAANAMSGTRKEQYSALQPEPMTPVRSPAIATTEQERTSSGWFWR